MTSKARMKQIEWQIRNGSTPQKRRAAIEELRQIGEKDRRLRGGS